MPEGYPGNPSPYQNMPPHHGQGPHTSSPHETGPHQIPSHLTEEEGTRMTRPNDMRNVPMAPGQAGWGVNGEPIFRDPQQQAAFDAQPPAHQPFELVPVEIDSQDLHFGPTGEPTVLPRWDASHRAPSSADRPLTADEQAAYYTAHQAEIEERAKQTRRGITGARYVRPGHQRPTEYETDFWGRPV